MSTKVKPNILFIFSDQQRWDTCGCYGQPLDITPNLDRLARDGVRFQHAFTCQPVCGPARACLQTGKYATELGCHTNHRMLPLGEPTLPRMLRTQGYEVGYIGKWHLASYGPRDGADDFRTRPVPTERRGGYTDFWLASDVLEFTSHGYDGHMFDSRGFRREFPPGRYRVDAQTDWVLEYLQTRSGEQPFFLFTSYIEPHHQNDRDRYEGPEGSKEKFAHFEAPPDLREAGGDWREQYPDYLGCIHSLDGNVGRIMQKLEELGLAENTLVIYTSDHGCHFRTRNAEYKRSCHDNSIRVPLIARGPGFSGSGTPPEPVSLIDLPPTILAAAGVDIPETMHGRPLQELAAGRAPDWPEDVFVQISESQCGRAVRTLDWKYSVTAPDASGHQPGSSVYMEDCLYDLREDPWELNNLVRDPARQDVRADMAARLKRHMRAAGEPEPEIRPASSAGS
mgnify:CR=1 FL=1